MKQNILLKIAYDGSLFLGWQKNGKGGPTIEETLQFFLEQILQESLALQAASRTDRGVHADEQWVNFHSGKNPSLEGLKKRLNALLPNTIRVLSIHRMPSDFHPTLHAQQKEYHYKVCYGPLQLPKERFFSWHVPYMLDLEKMGSACRYFVGEHDFLSFCNARKNLHYKDTRRRIEKVELFLPEKNCILFVIKGNHFLYKMVRNIVGTLVFVGRGKMRPEAIPTILTTRHRALAGMTAPAHGLTLKRVYYPQEFKLEL
jgi:tRNA pseudouridine38-40 synthase